MPAMGMTKSVFAGMTKSAYDVRDGFFLMQAFVGMMVRVVSVVKKRKTLSLLRRQEWGYTV